MRLDTTLVDFNDMHWVRGDISFIYNGDAPPEAALTVVGDTELVEGAFYVSPLTNSERNALSLRRDGSNYRR